jgi:GNAT superfamily N-acetyltransferase
MTPGSAPPEKTAAYCTLRAPRAGDLGWIVHRHGKLYAEEYGYNEKFEAVVAEIVADFLRAHDPQRERCWLAEHAGEIVGSVMLVKKSDEVAKLRLMLVEPHARGRGVGRAMVRECVRFARAAGYRKITLWTHRNLAAARRLYESQGFRLVHSEPATEGFGQELIDETWELELRSAAAHPPDLRNSK